MKDFNTWLKDNNLQESIDDAKKKSEAPPDSKEAQLKRCQKYGQSITSNMQKKRLERRNKNRPNYLG